MSARMLACLLLTLLALSGMDVHAPCRRAAAIPESAASHAETERNSPVNMVNGEALTLRVNGHELDVVWEDNAAVRELLSHAQKESIVVNAALYGGFEQAGSLPWPFTREDAQMTAVPGDVVLYAGDQLVVFFGSNSWSYTRLGHIEGLSGDGLSDLLNVGSAVIEIRAD